MTVCAVRDVSVRRGDTEILRDVNLGVDAGELVALVGPNGAGKSTLLSVLSGDVAPDTGTVTLDERALDSWSTAALARRRAVLPQSVNVAFAFRVIDVVRMGRSPYHRAPESEHDDDVVQAAMAEMAIDELGHRRHPSLSGGEQARVAIARVLAQSTPVLLLDEPTAALDVRFQELTLCAVSQRVKNGATAIVVLHDLALAAAYATRVVLLCRGEVVGDGSPTDVLTPQQLSRVYEHPIEVIPHPTTGAPLITPNRPYER